MKSTTSPDAGPSGASGFTDEAGGRVLQRCRPQFTHSDYFYRLNYQNTWIPFLKGEAPKQGAGVGIRPRNWKFRVVTIGLALTLLVLCVRFWRC